MVRTQKGRNTGRGLAGHLFRGQEPLHGSMGHLGVIWLGSRVPTVVSIDFDQAVRKKPSRALPLEARGDLSQVV
jgi:hypothetical protein